MKKYIGEEGGVEKMLEIIQYKLEKVTCDDTMKIACSVLCSLTDMCPDNCQRFINNNGISIFISCKVKLYQSCKTLY